MILGRFFGPLGWVTEPLSLGPYTIDAADLPAATAVELPIVPPAGVWVPVLTQSPGPMPDNAVYVGDPADLDGGDGYGWFVVSLNSNVYGVTDPATGATTPGIAVAHVFDGVTPLLAYVLSPTTGSFAFYLQRLA